MGALTCESYLIQIKIHDLLNAYRDWSGGGQELSNFCTVESSQEFSSSLTGKKAEGSTELRSLSGAWWFTWKSLISSLGQLSLKIILTKHVSWTHLLCSPVSED